MQTAQLDNVAHANLTLDPRWGTDLGDPAGQVQIFVPEIPQVQREYPILFARNEDGAASPIAILGLLPDELLFENGTRWDARYVPAAVRKGPFLLSGKSADDPAVHIMLDHPKIADNADRAEPLFLKHGGHAPALEDALEALRIIHTGFEPTVRMTKLFDEVGLIQPLSLDIKVSDTQTVNFDNFHAILPEAIDALSAEHLGQLNDAGILQTAVLIAHSLGNVNDLIRRKRMRMD